MYNHTRNYFDFQGQRYGVGTIVKLKSEAYGCGKEIERCNGIAKFVGGLESGYIKFSGIVSPGDRYCGIGWVAKPEDKIEKILTPVFYENKPTWEVAMDNYSKIHPARRADITPGTVFYILAMIVGAIFKAKIGIWIVATFFYLKYLVDMYRD